MSRIATWAVLIACVLAIAGCKKKARFQEFTSADGSFKVLMPGKPKEQVTSTGILQLKTYTIDEKDGGYLAGFGDWHIRANESEAESQQRLDAVRDWAVQSMNWKLKKETKISLDSKFPGRDIEAELPDGKGIYRARIWLVNRRLYQMAVIGTHSWASSADATKFLDSFSLTE